MKIIHCADLHLDAKLTAHLDNEKARERRQEILMTFKRMVKYASNEKIEAILIAGDLFDTKNVSALTRNTVRDEIISHPEIDFYYLKGNHDIDNFLSSLEIIPTNLHLFNDEWTKYELTDNGQVVLYGAELTKENSERIQQNFAPDPSLINIVMLHGQLSESNSKEKCEIINLRQFRNKGIDYLALGHVHEYQRERLDGTGVYCYCGCLDPRGFDECGEHGFVVLTVDENKKEITDEFVPFSSRRVFETLVDVSNLNDTASMVEAAKTALNELSVKSEDLIKITIIGEVDVECEKDIRFLERNFEEDYYYVTVCDKTKLRVDYTAYAFDESLKGEFVRTVQAAELSDEEKSEIIRIGLLAISGGDFL